MKILISAETVRQAKASGQTSLPAGNNVLITPEARGLADQLGITLDASNNSMTLARAAKSECSPQFDALRAEIVSRLPADVASKPELVEQIVNKVCQAQKNAPASPVACPVSTAPGGIKLVKGSDVHLGVFPGAGAEKQVGIADVITAADGAPIAAGFMAWSQCFFPWTLDYDEIDLVLEGELHIRCNGQTYVGKAGDVFYIPKNSAIEFGTTTAVRFFYVTYPANWQG